MTTQTEHNGHAATEQLDATAPLTDAATPAPAPEPTRYFVPEVLRLRLAQAFTTARGAQEVAQAAVDAQQVVAGRYQDLQNMAVELAGLPVGPQYRIDFLTGEITPPAN